MSKPQTRRHTGKTDDELLDAICLAFVKNDTEAVGLGELLGELSRRRDIAKPQGPRDYVRGESDPAVWPPPKAPVVVDAPDFGLPVDEAT